MQLGSIFSLHTLSRQKYAEPLVLAQSVLTVCHKHWCPGSGEWKIVTNHAALARSRPDNEQMRMRIFQVPAVTLPASLSFSLTHLLSLHLSFCLYFASPSLTLAQRCYSPAPFWCSLFSAEYGPMCSTSRLCHTYCCWAMSAQVCTMHIHLLII